MNRSSPRFSRCSARRPTSPLMHHASAENRVSAVEVADQQHRRGFEVVEDGLDHGLAEAHVRILELVGGLSVPFERMNPSSAGS